MNFSTPPWSRLASAMASITRAVPATLICHMRCRSRTPARTWSRTKARCTTATGWTSFSRGINCRQDSSFPRSMRTKRMERWVLGGLMSMPRTEKSPICDNRRVPKLPDTPVTKTTGFPLSIPGSILGSRRFGLARFFAGFGFRGRVHLRRRGSPSSGTRSRGNSGAEIGFVQSRLG